jgi:glutamate synthase (NADPH/NADH) small chain
VARETIPLDRLPDDILQRELEDALAASGAVERRQWELNAANTVDSLLGEGFDAVLLALGLTRSIPLPGAARPAQGVFGALEFLRRVKREGERISGAVAVLGGGNTAIDAALSALRAGAQDVYVVYRRSFAEMPAWPEERDAAVRAGVHFLVLTQPLDYVSDPEGRLTGVKVARTRLGAPDDSGRRRPEVIPGTEHVLPCDAAVEAIGQAVEEAVRAALPGVEFTRNGTVATRPGSLATSRAQVWAAGDIVNGGSTVVQAVAEGTRAAREIDSALRAMQSVVR